MHVWAALVKLNNIKCPKCNNIVTQFLPVDYLNGDTAWDCETCGYRFKTDKNSEIKK